MNVLVIDDDPAVLSEVARALEHLNGFSTVSASDGVTGLNMIGDIKPDLLLLDWLMPGMTGIDILVELKRRDRAARPGYIVIMTAAPDVDLLVAIALEIGANEVISKPLTAYMIAEIAARARARAGLALKA